MRNHLSLCVVAAVMVLIPMTEALSAIPDSLWLAKTSGTWESGPDYGYYRVVVHRLAGEHAKDSVEVQILKAGSSGEVEEVLKTVKLDSPGNRGHVKDVSFTRINDKLMALAIDIEMLAMERIVQREIYLVTSDGQVRNLVKAEYKDIYE